MLYISFLGAFKCSQSSQNSIFVLSSLFLPLMRFLTPILETLFLISYYFTVLLYTLKFCIRAFSCNSSFHLFNFAIVSALFPLLAHIKHHVPLIHIFHAFYEAFFLSYIIYCSTRFTAVLKCSCTCQFRLSL